MICYEISSSIRSAYFGGDESFDSLEITEVQDFTEFDGLHFEVFEYRMGRDGTPWPQFGLSEDLGALVADDDRAPVVRAAAPRCAERMDAATADGVRRAADHVAGRRRVLSRTFGDAGHVVGGHVATRAAGAAPKQRQCWGTSCAPNSNDHAADLGLAARHWLTTRRPADEAPEDQLNCCRNRRPWNRRQSRR